MPTRLRYHERRLIAKGLAKASDFENNDEKKSKDKEIKAVTINPFRIKSIEVCSSPLSF